MTVSPIVTSSDALFEQEGKRITLLGTYVQIDVRMRQRPPEVYRGHAGVQLSDGTTVYLEPLWLEAAIRSEAERTRTGKKVRVTGTFYTQMPPAPEPMTLPMVPCLHPVTTVVEVLD